LLHSKKMNSRNSWYGFERIVTNDFIQDTGV